MKNIILGLGLCLLASIGTESAFAQKGAKKSVKVTSSAVASARGANPHIKMDKPSTDKEVTKPRGTYCSVNFNNHTGYVIDIYVDGNFKGTLAAYDAGSVTVYSGYTTIYCISAGKTKEWNASGNCDGQYNYDLYN